MPYGEERVAATYAREILRSYTGAELAENAVVDGSQVPLNPDGRRIIETGTVMIYVGVNEVQTVTVTTPANPFTLTFGGSATGNIAGGATAAVVAAALEGLPTVGPGNVTVGGPAGGPFVVTFVNDLGGRDVGAITATNAAIAQTTAGGSTPGPGQKVRPAPGAGITAAQVAGVMMTTTEFWPDVPHANKSDKPVALFTKNCNFETSQLIGYSGNSAAVKLAMQGNQGRLSNCNFE